MTSTRTLPPAMQGAVVQLLYDAAQDIEELGATLCLDPTVAAQHLVSLQGLDRLSQLLSGLAAVLEAEDKIGALEAASLSELRDRLGHGAQPVPAPSSAPVPAPEA